MRRFFATAKALLPTELKKKKKKLHLTEKQYDSSYQKGKKYHRRDAAKKEKRTLHFFISHAYS